MNEEGGSQTLLSQVLFKYHLNIDDSRSRLAALQAMYALLPVTRDLSAVLEANAYIIRSSEPINQECATLFLQHGSRIDYSEMYLTGDESTT